MKTSSYRSSLIMLTATLFAILSGCHKITPDESVSGESKLRVVHAASGEGSMEAYAGNNNLTTADIAYGETTGYIKVPSGMTNIAFVAANKKTEASFNLTPSIAYTAYLVSDRSGKTEIVTHEDNLSNTETGKVMVKFLNLTPFFSTGINVSVQSGIQFVNGLFYKESTNYFSVEAGVTLRYNVVGSGVMKLIDGKDLEAGKIYTVWFSGNSTSTLAAHLIANN